MQAPKIDQVKAQPKDRSPERDRIVIAALGIELCFDPSLGILSGFSVQDGGRQIAPLHQAPWVGTAERMPPEAAPHLRRLGGDFFCAPYGVAEGDKPMHGWPPNTGWTVTHCEDGQLSALLDKTVQGAALSKTLSMRDHHPFVYQEHCFEGGQGRIPASNHANVSVLSAAHIRTSPKAHWETPLMALEPDPARGRSALRYPARAQNATVFPGANGAIDLTKFPWGPMHEDLAIGIEAPGHALGWTAVTRADKGDLFLSLRNPAQMPMTVLWHSNGGRDYAPWSGRHRGCLGVEEAAAEHLLGLSSSADLVGPGMVELGGKVRLRHVIGAIDWPSCEAVCAVSAIETGLRVEGDGGALRVVPFDASFLGMGPS